MGEESSPSLRSSCAHGKVSHNDFYLSQCYKQSWTVLQSTNVIVMDWKQCVLGYRWNSVCVSSFSVFLLEIRVFF
jgi:hypothetical protein